MDDKINKKPKRKKGKANKQCSSYILKRISYIRRKQMSPEERDYRLDELSHLLDWLCEDENV